MLSFEKIAIIGDSEIVFAFRAMGFKVFTPKNVAEARRALETVIMENFGLCFLHYSYFEPLAEERKEIQKSICPVLVGFSDYRDVTDQIQHILRETAIKATGSDLLAKGKG
jgi:vacuolar-type H+-ATPase subunit F/Vma7